MGGREALLIDKPMIFKVEGTGEPGWMGEDRGPTEEKDFSEGRGTSTALEFISQGWVCTSVPPVTDGVNLDEPRHLSEPQFPHLLRCNNIFLGLFKVNEIKHAKDLWVLNK